MIAPHHALGPESRLLWHPDLKPWKSFDDTIIDLEESRLRFSGHSGQLVWKLSSFPADHALAEFSDGTNSFPLLTVISHAQYLFDEGVVLDLSAFDHDLNAEAAIFLLRKAAKFYNRRVTANSVVRDIFGGSASRAIMLGYAIEFYFYVEAAARYMAMGIARFDEPADRMEPYWRHFADEARHSEIFRQGLLEAGMSAERLESRQAIASTSALLNFLFERSSRSLVEFGSLFTIMQPDNATPSIESVEGKYHYLKSHYPYATPILSAFQKHDMIDLQEAHQSWALESHVRGLGGLSARELHLSVSTMADASCFFLLFFDGIRRFYVSDERVKWKSLADVETEFTPL